MQLFYSGDLQHQADRYEFDKEESKHIVKVLRKRVGDLIHITNGQGWLMQCEITSDLEKRCEVKILKSEFFEPKSYHLHIAIAPTKMMDRLEWFLEKATEIGLSEITPIICDNSERKELKTERLEKIALSAMKQSLQYYLPKVNPPIKLKDFLSEPREGQCYIAHCEPTQKREFIQAVKPQGVITILIGPEGDFSVPEIQQALSLGYHPVALGETRLRTETAALMASAVVANKALLSL